jgi:hypothetical protein
MRSSLTFLDTNIDEVLRLSDLSMVPKSFLTEIQEDQVYETILHELQKKISHQISLKTLSVQEQQKPLSPHLLAINDDDDDDDISIADGTSSSTSSEKNDAPFRDDYDTDIELGKNIFRINLIEK